MIGSTHARHGHNQHVELTFNSQEHGREVPLTDKTYCWRVRAAVLVLSHLLEHKTE